MKLWPPRPPYVDYFRPRYGELDFPYGISDGGVQGICAGKRSQDVDFLIADPDGRIAQTAGAQCRHGQARIEHPIEVTGGNQWALPNFVGFGNGAVCLSDSLFFRFGAARHFHRVAPFLVNTHRQLERALG